MSRLDEDDERAEHNSAPDDEHKAGEGKAPDAPFASKVHSLGEGWLATPPPARKWLATFMDPPPEGSTPDEVARRRRGLIARGELHVLAGEGGVGKGRFAMQLGLAVAAHAGSKGGPSVLGLDIHPIGAGEKVLFLVGEDDAHEIHLRSFGAAAAEGFDEAQRRKIGELVRWRTFRGESFVLASVDGKDGVVKASPDLDNLRAYLEAEGPFALVVIDPLARFSGVDDENANARMHALCAAVESLCEVESRPAVVLVAHTKKPDKPDGKTAPASQHDVRGASSIVNAARVVVAMTNTHAPIKVDCKGMAEGESGYSDAADPREIVEHGVTVACVKNNLSGKGADLRLSFHVDGGLLVLEPKERARRRKDKHALAPAKKTTAKANGKHGDSDTAPPVNTGRA